MAADFKNGKLAAATTIISNCGHILLIENAAGKNLKNLTLDTISQQSTAMIR